MSPSEEKAHIRCRDVLGAILRAKSVGREAFSRDDSIRITEIAVQAAVGRR